VPETLPISLDAKALDRRSRHPVLVDATADAIVRALPCDFDRLRAPGGPEPRISLPDPTGRYRILPARTMGVPSTAISAPASENQLKKLDRLLPWR
jgi:O-methyltransferase involved in polyketide biosynthesis